MCGADRFMGSYLCDLLIMAEKNESIIQLPLFSRMFVTLAFEIISLRLWHRYSHTGTSSEGGISLVYLLVAFHRSKSSDLRDKAYALFALAKDSSDLHVDYVVDLLDLYINIFKHIYELSDHPVSPNSLGQLVNQI
jgi:hypothetical protein